MAATTSISDPAAPDPSPFHPDRVEAGAGVVVQFPRRHELVRVRGRVVLRLAPDEHRRIMDEVRASLPCCVLMILVLVAMPTTSTYDDLDEIGRVGHLVALCLAGASLVVFGTALAHARLTRNLPAPDRVPAALRQELLGLFLLGVGLVTATFTGVRMVAGTPTATGTSLVMATVLTATGVSILRPPPPVTVEVPATIEVGAQAS